MNTTVVCFVNSSSEENMLRRMSRVSLCSSFGRGQARITHNIFVTFFISGVISQLYLESQSGSGMSISKSPGVSVSTIFFPSYENDSDYALCVQPSGASLVWKFPVV